MEVYEFPSTPMGNDTEAGILRTAGKEDERNCQCEDAALTPSNLYALADFRRASTEYDLGDVVACPYHGELQLKCMAAGITGTDALKLDGVKVGNIITDGTVEWTVEPVGGSIVVNYGSVRDRDGTKPTYGLE